MLTAKDIKEFRGLDQKAVIKTAETIGRNGSEGTVYGRLIGLAIAAGEDAKAEGLKGYSFERAFDAFAGQYMPDATEGTLKTYRSAVNNWCKAGAHAAFNAQDVAIRVFNEKGFSLSQRGTWLGKLLGDKPPTAKEYAAAKPKGNNERGGSTIKGSAKALVASVGNFGVKYLKEMSPENVALYNAVVVAANALQTAIEGIVEAPKPTTEKGKGKTEPTMAEKRKAMLAQLASMTAKSKTGTKTIN